MTRLRRELHAEAVAALYEAAHDPVQWTAALETLRLMFDGATACFGIENLQTHETEIIGIGSDRGFGESYRSHYIRHNVLWRPMAEQPLGTVFSDRSLMPKPAFLGSTFYNEWLAPQGVYASLGCKLLFNESVSGFLNIQRGPHQDEFEAPDFDLMRQLAPVLIRVAALRRKLAMEAPAPATPTPPAALPGAAGLETLSSAVVVVDPALRVLSINPAAARLFDRGAGIGITGAGVLSVAGQEALLRLVAACSRGEEANGTLRVPRPAPALPLTIVALPLRDLQRGPVAAGISAGGEPAALLLISDPELRQAARREDLIQRFGLTRAEADFALEIVKGDGKRAAAARRGISYATARTHLSRIFEKTGTRRQAELVHRLLAIERGAANDAFSQPGPLL